MTSGFSMVFFQGQTKSRVFQGLPGISGFVGHADSFSHIKVDQVTLFFFLKFQELKKRIGTSEDFLKKYRNLLAEGRMIASNMYTATVF